MVHALEIHGRLSPSDGNPVNPGNYDLTFRLHPSREGDAALWEDHVRGVPVAAGGYYHALLGANNALDASLFTGTPRFLSVRNTGAARGGVELAERVPVLGMELRLAAELAELTARTAALEHREPVVARRLRLLRRHLRNLEGPAGPVALLAARVAAIEGRLGRLDAEGGRVVRLEDDVEDLVGPDGDVVDLDERLVTAERRLLALEALASGRSRG